MDRPAPDHTNCKVLSEAEGGHFVRYSTPAVESLETPTTRNRKQGNPKQPTYRGILVEHLRPIWTLKDLENFKNAFREIMLCESSIVSSNHFWSDVLIRTAHHMIYISISGSLHCDVNLHHFVMHCGDNNTVHGALVDFDLASLEEPACEYKHERRNKARRFISRELVKSATRNLERFDWESFYYVLCWIGTHYSEGAEIKTNALHSWDARDDDVVVECKSTALAGNMIPSFITLFTAFYKPVYRSWIMPMQQLFFAADMARLELEELRADDDTLSFNEGAVDSCITWEKLWGIIRN